MVPATGASGGHLGLVNMGVWILDCLLAAPKYKYLVRGGCTGYGFVKGRKEPVDRRRSWQMEAGRETNLAATHFHPRLTIAVPAAAGELLIKSTECHGCLTASTVLLSVLYPYVSRNL